MTKDDIIRMAREAGLERDGYWEFDMNRLERFAALVAAKERESCALLCEQLGAEGYGTLAVAASLRRRGAPA